MKISAAIVCVTFVSFARGTAHIGSVEVTMSDGSIYGQRLYDTQHEPDWMAPHTPARNDDYRVYIRKPSFRNLAAFEPFWNISVHETHDPEEHLPVKVTMRVKRKQYSTLSELENYNYSHPPTNPDLGRFGRVYVAVKGTEVILSAKIKFDLSSREENERVVDHFWHPHWAYRRHTNSQ